MGSLPSNIEKLLILFVFMLIIFHIILVWWLNLNEKAWKISEYIWLGIATLSIISISVEVRQTVASNKMLIEKTRAEVQLSLLRSYSGGNTPPTYICRTFIRSEYSPPPEDFIFSQQEYDTICKWNKQFLNDLPSDLKGALPELLPDNYLPKYKPTDPVLVDYLANLKMYFSTYKEYRDSFITLEKLTHKSGVEGSLFYLSPILLCFALALRITKVTGELKLKKYNK